MSSSAWIAPSATRRGIRITGSRISSPLGVAGTPPAQPPPPGVTRRGAVAPKTPWRPQRAVAATVDGPSSKRAWKATQARPLAAVKWNTPLGATGSRGLITSSTVDPWSGSSGYVVSTVTGTRPPLDVVAGRRSRGWWRDSAPPSACRGGGTVVRSPAAAARRRNLRRDTGSDGGAVRRGIEAGVSVAAGVQLAALVRPRDVGLERLHRVGVGAERHALVGLLDAPVDHVPQRRELVHL